MVTTVTSTTFTLTLQTDLTESPPPNTPGILHGTKQSRPGTASLFLWVADSNHLDTAVAHLSTVMGYNADSLLFIPYSSKENWIKNYPFAVPAMEWDEQCAKTVMDHVAQHPFANPIQSFDPIDSEPIVGGYFDDSRNDKRNLVNTAPENFRNTSFPRCIPREWMALPPYHHARLMAPLLMANACLQSERYTYEEVINNEDTPVQNFISFLKMAVAVLSSTKYINIAKVFGKRRWKKKEAGKLEDSAAGGPAAGKLEAKWGMQVHYQLSEKAWASYVAGVNKNKRRKTLQFGVFFESEDDVKPRKTKGGTSLLIPLTKHAINICERLMSKLEIHREKQEIDEQLIMGIVADIIVSQQEEVKGDIEHLGCFETIHEDDRLHNALRSICTIIGRLASNSIKLIRQDIFFKQDDETKQLKKLGTLTGDDSDSSDADS
eukprot:scaffold110210_cov36-Cyclotella_meneghiniana.AAC.2